MNVQTQNRGRGRPAVGDKRRRVLGAALELFAERGFHGTAIPEIAARAGIAGGTIYRYFASKEALVNALYRECKGALTERLFIEFATEAPLRVQFQTLWRNLAAFARAQPTAFAFLELHHHGDYLDDESRALELRALVPIGLAFEQARLRGEVKQTAPQVAIAMVWGAFVGLVKAARLGYLTLDDAAIDSAERICWDAIRAANPTTSGDPT